MIRVIRQFIKVTIITDGDAGRQLNLVPASHFILRVEEMFVRRFQAAIKPAVLSRSFAFFALLLTATPVAFTEDFLQMESAKFADVAGGVNSASWRDELEICTDPLIVPVSCSKCGNNDRSCSCGNDRWVDIWDGRMEIGLNGAEGNSRNINLVTGFDAKQTSGNDTLTIDVDYLFSRDEIQTTKNRFYSLTRLEREGPNSSWGTFADGWFEYDELETFKARLGLHAGGVVTLVKTQKSLFKGLIGVGTSKEFQGADTVWRPEGFLGSVWEKTITSRQDFYVRSVLFPDFGNSGEFRLNARAGWEYAMNDEKTVKLGLSAFDRYDSLSDAGDRKNNIDYWASLIWDF